MQEGLCASALAEFPVQLSLNHESTADSTPRVGFAARPMRGLEPFVDALDIPVVLSPDALLPVGFDKVASSRGFRLEVLARGEAGSMLVRVLPDSTMVFMSASTEQRLRSLRDSIREQAFKAEAETGRDRAQEVEVVIWWHTHTGSAKRTRRVTAPAWDDGSRGNYPLRVRGALDNLMSAGPPAGTGRLILWHGEPGTGKTTAVLALLRAWRRWCEGFVITDPERMFLETHYLQEVLTTEPMRNRLLPDDHDETPKWRLIVAEDADEYLRADAKQRSGPALGRLLNASDGILGRGSRTVILLTTNDDLGRLHPAVTRPGRAMAIVEFSRFDNAEANQWLGGEAIAPAHGATLAELYELRDHVAGPGVTAEAPLQSGAYL